MPLEHRLAGPAGPSAPEPGCSCRAAARTQTAPPAADSLSHPSCALSASRRRESAGRPAGRERNTHTANLLAQGLPPIWLIKSSWVRPCCINQADTRSTSAGSGRTRDASSASCVCPMRLSRSITSCLLYCCMAITKPLCHPHATIAQRSSPDCAASVSPAAPRRAGDVKHQMKPLCQRSVGVAHLRCLVASLPRCPL